MSAGSWMGSRSLRPQDILALRHFSATKLMLKCPDTSDLGPKCPDISAPNHLDTSAPILSRITGGAVSRRNCPGSEASRLFLDQCRSVLALMPKWHFGTPVPVPKCFMRLWSILVPKFLVAEVSSNRWMSCLLPQRGRWSEVSWRRKLLVPMYIELLTTSCGWHSTVVSVSVCVLLTTQHVRVGGDVHVLVTLCLTVIPHESQKTCHQTFVLIYAKYWPICKILPLAHTVENLQ